MRQLGVSIGEESEEEIEEFLNELNECVGWMKGGRPAVDGL